MTSTATVVAALPLAIDSSPGWESRMPMALAIIGGNIVSTLFTLYVVPCAYNLLAALEKPNSATDDDELLLGAGADAFGGAHAAVGGATLAGAGVVTAVLPACRAGRRRSRMAVTIREFAARFANRATDLRT